MKMPNMAARGFSLVELMVAVTVGLFLIGAVIEVYLSQTRTYKSATSQANLQNGINAIAALITPVARNAGFTGCASVSQGALSNLNPGAPLPLNATGNSVGALFGYEAVGTAGNGSSLAINQDNAANDATASHWSPALDASILGNVEPGSDVVVFLNAVPNVDPTGVTVITNGTNSFTVHDASNASAGQYGTISDCSKAVIFKVTGINGNVIVHDQGAGVGANATSSLAKNFNVRAQFVPMQLTAFFVGHAQGDQSALIRAIYNNGVWDIEPLVFGVDTLQVQYGIGSGDIVTGYVTADAVTDWSAVYTVRMAFLLQGGKGTGSGAGQNPNTYSLLGTAVTVPADGRMRHVYETTINLRNAL